MNTALARIVMNLFYACTPLISEVHQLFLPYFDLFWTNFGTKTFKPYFKIPKINL